MVREIHRIATSTPESTDQVPNELAINKLSVYLYEKGLITLKDKNVTCGKTKLKMLLRKLHQNRKFIEGSEREFVTGLIQDATEFTSM